MSRPSSPTSEAIRMRKRLAETSCGLCNTRNSRHLPAISFAEARRPRRSLHSENELSQRSSARSAPAKVCNPAGLNPPSHPAPGSSNRGRPRIARGPSLSYRRPAELKHTSGPKQSSRRECSAHGEKGASISTLSNVAGGTADAMQREAMHLFGECVWHGNVAFCGADATQREAMCLQCCLLRCGDCCVCCSCCVCL